MCCGKMVRLPGEKERKILTTGDISIDLDKENREKKDDEKGIGSRSWWIHRKPSGEEA